MILDWRLMAADSHTADGALIDLPRWRERHLIHTSVGRCDCGGAVMTMAEPRTEGRTRRVWLDMICFDCAHEWTMPADRPVRTPALSDNPYQRAGWANDSADVA